jgi:hypothetical protein
LVPSSAGLTRARQMDVCGQCHSNAITNRGPAFSYRPGEPLEAHFRTAQVKHREEDHVADQVKYLRQSKCFQKSDTLTCTTCHNPHRPHRRIGPRGMPEVPPACGLPSRVAARSRRGSRRLSHAPVYGSGTLPHRKDQYVLAIRPYDHRIAVHEAARRGSC